MTDGKFQTRHHLPSPPKGKPRRIFTDSFHDGWHVRYEWGVVAGRPEPIGVEITPHWLAPDGWAVTADGRTKADQPGPAVGRAMTADALRKLPLGEMAAEGRQQLRVTAGTAKHHPQLVEEWPAMERFEVDARTRRGQRLTAEQLADVAKVYRAAWTVGDPVNEAVKTAFHLSRDGAAKRIQAARAAGLLDGVGPKR